MEEKREKMLQIFYESQDFYLVCTIAFDDLGGSLTQFSLVLVSWMVIIWMEMCNMIRFGNCTWSIYTELIVAVRTSLICSSLMLLFLDSVMSVMDFLDVGASESMPLVVQ